MPQDNAADAPGVTGTEQTPATEPAREQVESRNSKVETVLEKLGVPVELHGEIGKGPSPNDLKDEADDEGEEEAPPIENNTEVEAAADVPQKGTEEAKSKKQGAKAGQAQDASESAENPRATQDDEDEKPPADAKPGWERKRIGQLARQKRERDDRIAELEAQLGEQTETKEPVFVDRGLDPLAHITSPDALAKIHADARQLRKTCHLNPNGFTANAGTDKERVVTPEEVANWLNQAEDLLDVEIPRKAAQLQQKAVDDELARTEFPQLFDKRTQEYQIGKMLDRELPGLATHPSRNLVIGDYLRGAKMRIEKAAKAGERNGATNGHEKPNLPEALTRNQNGHIPPIAPETARVPSNSPAVPQARKLVADATKNVIAEGGTFESIKNLILAKRKANQTGNTNPRSAAAV